MQIKMADFDITNQLTASEKEAFFDLKKRISSRFEDFCKEDYSVYRFLKARKFNVQKAENMIIEYMKFRERFKMDTILEDFKPPEVLAKYCAYNILGFDKEGSPIAYMDIGNSDAKGIMKSTKKEDRIKNFLCFLELSQKLMREQTKKLGKPIESSVHIVNFENYSIGQATYKAGLDEAMEINYFYEANYPERLKAGIMINCPAIFTYVFNMFKMAMPPETIQKIKCFGKDGWKEELLKRIDPEILPGFLGGNRCDPDGNPRCITQLVHGSMVPKHYYFKTHELQLVSKPGVQKYDLRRRNSIQIIHRVRKPGSFLEWEFESENHNIGFGLFFREKEDQVENSETLIPIQKVDAHFQTEAGQFLCGKIGLYTLVLDNTYSWFTSKHVYLKSCVVEPNEERNQAGDNQFNT